MKRTRSYSGTTGHANNYICIFIPAIVHFGQVIHNGIKPTTNEVPKLHFHYRFHSVYGKSHGCRHHSGLTYGGIPDPFLSKSINESFCNFKDPAIFSDVLTQNNQLVVLFHGLFQPF